MELARAMFQLAQNNKKLTNVVNTSTTTSLAAAHVSLFTIITIITRHCTT